MSLKRIVDTSFWTDDKVVNDFSVEDKYFMLYLMTNPHTTQLGIYPLNKKYMAFELGYSKEVVDVLLDRFENKYHMIKYSNATGEIALKNSLKYSIVKGGKPVEDLLTKEIKGVKDKSLLKFVYEGISNFDNLNKTVEIVFTELKEKIVLKESNDNDNDNDNDVSYHDSYNDSYHDSCQTKRFAKPTLEQVTEYCNERQNQVDPQRFIDFYESKGWMVGKNHMKDWKACVRTWEKKETKHQELIPDYNKQNNIEISDELMAKYFGDK